VYVRTRSCRSRWRDSDAVLDRMSRAGITSLPQLLRWARERFPDAWHRIDYMSGKTGRQQTIELWANYLEWSDAI
jgi:hypothetical protein